MSHKSFKLNKLVRDGLVESAEEMGATSEVSILTGTHLLEGILDKIEEEVGEARAQLRETGKIELEELADLRELPEAAAVGQGHTLTELHSVQYDKRREKGSFIKGLFVKTQTWPAGSDMAKYYASNPDRFPEIK